MKVTTGRAHKHLATSRLELWCVRTLAEVFRTSIVLHCVCQDVCTHCTVREGQALTDVTLLCFVTLFKFVAYEESFIKSLMTR